MLIGLGGCAATPPELDAKFASGWRPSQASCAFGGETPTLAAWCAEVNFGSQGLLAIARTVNEEVLANAADGSLACSDHVAQARKQLAAYPYTLTDLYSCDAEPPIESGRPVCHVSLLVTSASGGQVVLDNGHVLEPGVTGGVASYGDFTALVDVFMIGEEPEGFEFAHIAGRPKLADHSPASTRPRRPH